jgi:oligopeptide transport system substrate-binding protein
LKNKAIVLFLITLVCSTVFAACGLFGLSQQDSLSGEGILNLSGTDQLTLDPAVSSEMTSHDYIVQIFSGLLKFDSNMEPAADIAQNWQVSPDGTKYTFNLRQDVKFQDGKHLTASDFKYSWERACAPSTRSLTASTYLGDIVGVGGVISGKGAQISGVRVVDDYTLEVTIDSPKSYFLSKLTYPTSFVVDKNTVSSGGLGWWRNPNGTGPFKLGQWTENQSLILERNDSYYGGAASLKQVAYQFLSGLPMDLYETGKIDVLRISSSYVDEATDKSGPYFTQLGISPELSFSYVGFGCNRPPFDDPRVRQAFCMAIDKDKIVSLVYRGMEGRADGILPPGMPANNQNLTGLGYDASKARDLIKGS